ncbi:hypothetical protein MUCCIDRAFT_78042 [Mucor lusitanicus CBS 277.49]|uniref:Uncharacterized protein n=1 Tax=Mucor lusitanicus CBS 277.49 TaxID=747725 RepID=A0A168NZI4_MUCCL|nr:hypothetical protein MUCCIDRAFT_78042 [Mucor lusitanicus CBS 277.49]
MVLLRCGPCKGWSRSPRIFLIKATLGQLLQGSGSVRFDLQALHTSWLKQQDTPHWPRMLVVAKRDSDICYNVKTSSNTMPSYTLIGCLYFIQKIKLSSHQCCLLYLQAQGFKLFIISIQI